MLLLWTGHRKDIAIFLFPSNVFVALEFIKLILRNIRVRNDIGADNENVRQSGAIDWFARLSFTRFRFLSTSRFPVRRCLLLFDDPLAEFFELVEIGLDLFDSLTNIVDIYDTRDLLVLQSIPPISIPLSFYYFGTYSFSRYGRILLW